MSSGHDHIHICIAVAYNKNLCFSYKTAYDKHKEGERNQKKNISGIHAAQYVMQVRTKKVISCPCIVYSAAKWTLYYMRYD